MKAVTVRELKANPSATLRQAREHTVVVLRHNQPEAVLVHLDEDPSLNEQAIRQALATALYRDRSLSIGQAARFSGMGMAAFIQHVSQLGIPVVEGTAETVREDAEIIRRWRNDSARL